MTNAKKAIAELKDYYGDKHYLEWLFHAMSVCIKGFQGFDNIKFDGREIEFDIYMPQDTYQHIRLVAPDNLLNPADCRWDVYVHWKKIAGYVGGFNIVEWIRVGIIRNYLYL